MSLLFLCPMVSGEMDIEESGMASRTMDDIDLPLTLFPDRTDNFVLITYLRHTYRALITH